MWAGETYRITEEDERVLSALCTGEFLDPADGFSLLSVVNAARSFERSRIIDNIGTLSPADQVVLSSITTWLACGAPDNMKEG